MIPTHTSFHASKIDRPVYPDFSLIWISSLLQIDPKYPEHTALRDEIFFPRSH